METPGFLPLGSNSSPPEDGRRVHRPKTGSQTTPTSRRAIPRRWANSCSGKCTSSPSAVINGSKTPTGKKAKDPAQRLNASEQNPLPLLAHHYFYPGPDIAESLSLQTAQFTPLSRRSKNAYSHQNLSPIWPKDPGRGRELASTDGPR